MLTAKKIRQHYNTPEVREAIMRVSTDSTGSRAGMLCKPNAFKDSTTGELRDSMDWYSGVGSSFNRKSLYKIDMSVGKYGFTSNVCRTVYWTLNVFDKDIYTVDFSRILKTEGPAISRKHTVGYTFGIDIDHCKGYSIHAPDVKLAVEDMAQYFSDRLREYLPNSVYCLYSGGGIYVMVHHKVFELYFQRFKENEDWDTFLLVLLDSFDALIADLRDEFFKLHPEHAGKVKPDQLNGSQRVFKTLFSLHKSLDYAVIPLNPEHVRIDFEKASLPLTQDVLQEGKTWYSSFDDGTRFLNNVMKPYFSQFHEKRNKSKGSCYGNLQISEVPVTDLDAWAPCMKNLWQLPECGESATRALAAFAAYLGQLNIDEDTAHGMFISLGYRWNARTSNIFESYFKIMHTPTCNSLNSNSNVGFPKGCSLKKLNVCKPDARCLRIASPSYYSDSNACANLLKSKLHVPVSSS